MCSKFLSACLAYSSFRVRIDCLTSFQSLWSFSSDLPIWRLGLLCFPQFARSFSVYMICLLRLLCYLALSPYISLCSPRLAVFYFSIFFTIHSLLYTTCSPTVKADIFPAYDYVRIIIYRTPKIQRYDIIWLPVVAASCGSRGSNFPNWWRAQRINSIGQKTHPELSSVCCGSQLFIIILLTSPILTREDQKNH